MIDENTWYWVRDQSLAIAARNAGFDLAVYHDYSAAVQDELRKRAIKTAMKEIRMAFDDQADAELSEIKEGVYVISLTSPLTIKYKNKCSEVIYIGIGNINSRIESHFNNSLFDFMQSLSGAEFDFRFAKPKLAYHKDYYKHIEYEMLDYFKNSAGSLPILNTNAGSNRNINTADDWWVTPLRGTGEEAPVGTDRISRIGIRPARLTKFEGQVLMEFRIADAATASLNRLPEQDQTTAKITVCHIQPDP